MYKEFLIIFFIIIVHEIGHLIMALIFKWKLDKISIYPYGGLVKFNEKINRPLREELLILISGPLVQVILFMIITIIFRFNLISFRNYNLFKTYHYTLLLFNLLPIYPLDGGRILNILANYLLPYKKGNKLVGLFSILVIFLVVISIKNINLVFMSILLLFEIYKYFKNQDYLYNKLLLERYLGNYNFKRFKIINDKELMYKERKHLIKIKDKYLKERDYLKERFR